MGKSWLDLHADGKEKRYTHDAEGIAELVGHLGDLAPDLVALEATGGYERALYAMLQEAGIPVHRAAPSRVRHFANGIGVFAKTDQTDARVIATYAERVDIPTPHRTDAALMAARLLLERRETKMADIRREKCRLQHARDPLLREQVEATIAHHQEQADELERAAVAAMQPHAERLERLQAFPGVGPGVSILLAVFLPEIGHVEARKISSLAGLAPFPFESGTSVRGKRAIRGGRSIPRRALFIAAMNARRFKPYANLHARLTNQEKPKKVVICAIARKLLIRMNAAEKKAFSTYPLTNFQQPS